MVDRDIASEKAQRALVTQRAERDKTTLLDELANEKKKADNALALKQKEYDLLKAGFKDEVTRKLQHLQAVERIYGSISWSAMEIHQMGTEDPIELILSRFTKLAEMEDGQHD